MGVKKYYTVNGEIRAERDSSGFRLYARDNVGSVVKVFSKEFCEWRAL